MKRSIPGFHTLKNKRFVFLISTIIASAGAQPVLAQMAAPASVRPSVDPNGVDLFLGTFNAHGAPLVLGKAGGEGLTYQQFNTGSGWTDSSTVTLNLSGNVMTVILGSVSDSFTISGSTYTSTEGNGATLTANGNAFVYTRSDGTVINFDSTRAGAFPYYSNYGRVTSVTSPSGLTLGFSYYSIGYCSQSKFNGEQVCTQRSNAYRVTTVTSSAGYSLSFNYGPLDPYDPNDPSDQPNFRQFSTVLSVSSTNTATGAGGPSESFGYNGSAYYISDPAGRSTTYQLSNGAITGIQLPGSSGNDVTIAYGGGRVTGVTNSNGTTTYATTDNGGTRTVTVTDPASNATTYVFNIASQRITSVTDALHRTTSSAYDGNGRLVAITKPGNNGVSYSYDGFGNVTATTATAAGGGSSPISSAYYPCSSAATCNKPQWTKDGNGNETDYAYDATTGNITSVTSPASSNGVRPQTRYTYTSISGVSLPASISQCRTNASCAGGADEVKTTIAYNANLLPTSVSTGSGDGSLTATTAYTYDAVGNVTGIDGPLPGTADTTTFTYDADREVTSIVSADPDGSGPLKQRAIVYHYLPNGLRDSVVVGTVDGSGNFTGLKTAMDTFDANRRKVQSTVSAGGTTYSVTQYGYDGYGRPSCTAQRMNPSSWTSQGDACTLTAAGSFGNDRISRIGQYDALNRVTQVTNGYGTPEAATEQISYTPNGQTQSVTDANGNVTTYGYDGFDRLSTTTYPGGSYEQLSYDANGNVTHRRLRDGSGVDYGYDALNRMQHDSPAGERGVAYNYDNQNHLVEAAYDALGSGDAVTMAWDAMGRLASSTSRQGGVARTVSYGYDAAGREKSITHPDGVQFTMGYDVLGELRQAWWNAPATGTVPFLTYTVDDLGRPTTVNRASSYTYNGYDGASRMTSYSHAFNQTNGNTSVTLGYNAANQITSRSETSPEYAWGGAVTVNRPYAVNALNQYTSAGPATFTYDGRGNLTSDGSTNYGYDLENRMTSTSRGGGATLSYDPLGRLWQATGPNGMTRFLYDRDHVIAEYDGNNTLLRRFYWGPGSDEPVVQDEGGAMNCSGTRVLHPDERGSIVGIADCSGNRQQTNQYDEHGIPASGNWGRFQYTGQAWLPEVGMYYYKARMYSPTLGRFMQTDSIGYADGMNWYNYAHGDPVNGSDPSGTDNVNGSGDDDFNAGYFGDEVQVCGGGGISFMGGCYSAGSLIGSVLSIGYSGSSLPFGTANATPPKPTPAAGTNKPQKPKFTISHNRPPGAITCSAYGITFLAPPSFNLNQIVSAGRAGGLSYSAANGAVGHYGTFDFQRSRDGAGNTTFYSQYQVASNVAAGAYMYGTGLPEIAANGLEDIFGNSMSSNAGAGPQIDGQEIGWDAASGSTPISCHR